MNFDQLFNDLAADNSRLFKSKLLLENKENETLKRIIFLALDPFTQFYIRKIPAYAPRLDSGIFDLTWALKELDQLSSRNVTGNAGIEHLSNILENISIENARVIERVIKKDLKCGVSVSTVNSIWPGLIHEYPTMLCSGFDAKLVKKIKWPAIAQLKMDGMRFNAIVKNGGCEFRSRSGKQIDLLGNLEAEFIALAGGRDLVFDGELLVESGSGFSDRQTGNGILNKAVKGTISEAEASMVRATIWDLIDLVDFSRGTSSTTYETRFKLLGDTLVNRLNSKISIVESKVANSLEEAEAIFQEYLSQGQEGIILKDVGAKWEDGRSKSQIKFKGEEECDLLVVGVQPGTGKYEGMVGALICETSDGLLKTDVGSGLKDDDRKKSFDEYIGKIVAVKYNMRIKSKQGKDSLFLPVFIEVRSDKDMADAIDNVK